MKAEESPIPVGCKFLPGNTVESMRSRQLKEKDPKAAARLLSYIMRKGGKSPRQICATLNRSYSTIRNWLVRAVQLGVGGRYDIVNPGTPSRLDPAQLRQLKDDLIAGPQSCGFESGAWTARLVAGHIRRGSVWNTRLSACTTYCPDWASHARSPGQNTPNQPRNTGRRRSKKKPVRQSGTTPDTR